MRLRLALAVLALGVAACAAPSPPPAPSPSVAPSPSPSPPSLRLPASARPLRYDLALTIVPSEPSFTGTVGVELAVAEPTTVLWLNATELSITAASLTAGGETWPARVVPGGEGFVGFAFDRPLRVGPARLSIAYRGPLDGERSRGIYREREGAGEDAFYAYTFFEPIDARRAFPCFDEPAAKVPWRITLHVKKDHVALANTSVLSEVDEAGGMKAVTFAETRPLPSYLVAFVVGPFDVVDAGTAGHYGTPLRFIVPRGRRAETRYAAEVTPKIVGLLEDYFDMPYPYGKLDVAVVPRYWGTMEHPGLVALGQPLTLIAPGDETLARRQHYANIATHELAHYWFGDYVTMAWWDDTWLNEALGTWLEMKLTDRLEPAWHFADIHRPSAWAMPADALASAKKIRQPVVSNHDIEDAFDGEITYAKGASVLGMFEHDLGEDVFQRGIRRYLRAHAWGSAVADDLLAALSAEAGRDLGPAFKTFLDQPGVPLVSFEPVCSSGAPRLRLAQKRFVPMGSQAAAGASWQVPVCVKYGAGAETHRVCTVLASPSAELPLEGACPTWVMPNEGGAGYYRSGYTPASLRGLAEHGKGALSSRERASLLDDVAALAGTGALPLGDALGLLPVFADDRDRVAFESGFPILTAARVALATPELRRRFAHFLQRSYGERGHALGLLARPTDTADDRAVRLRLVALLGGAGEDAALRLEAHDRVARSFDDPGALPADVAPAALHLAGTSNDRALFARLRDAALAAQDHRVRGELAASLGGFTDPALEREALALLLDARLDLRDSIGILEAALHGLDTREPAWVFLKEHFDALSARMRSDEAVQVFRLADVFCDEAHRADAEAALTARAEKIEGAPRALAAALEEVHVCAAAAKMNQQSLEAFLRAY